MNIVRYTEANAERWDDFLPQTVQGVFLHSRKFLAYHGERFEDLSVLIEDDKGRLRALFPAARATGDRRQVVSHPGITYGGLLHHPGCRADEILAMLDGIRAGYRELGYRSLIYKTVPPHVQAQVVQSDLYALWRAEANLTRRDLWNVLDLRLPRKSSAGHKGECKKAMRADLSAVLLDAKDYAPFHELLAGGLMARHGAKPVHALDELLDLARRFPREIELWGCRAPDGELLAGTWLFKLRPQCWHTQYIMGSERGRALSAVDLLLEELVDQATQAGVAYFSFGNSTDEAGRSLNAGLFSFKAGFGAGAVVQDFYEVEL